MRKVGGNDTIEMWGYAVNGQPHVAWHDRKALDARAKLLIDLVKMSLHTTPLVDAMRGMSEESQPHKHSSVVSVQEVVMKAAETVDAIYDEATQRGWVIDLPAFDELDKA